MNRIIVTAALCGVFFVPANAQTVASTPVAIAAPSAPVTGLTPSVNVLRAGTKIPLKMSEALTTEGKKLRVGQRFQLEVAENIMIDGQTVVPIGSPATGEITEVRNKGMWGKSGRINARVLYVRANGRQMRLSGQIDDKGVTGTAGVVAAVALVPVVGFFTTGTSAKIPLGAPVTSFLDEDVTVAFAPAAAPTPMMVSPPQPVAAPSVAAMTGVVAAVETPNSFKPTLDTDK